MPVVDVAALTDVLITARRFDKGGAAVRAGGFDPAAVGDELRPMDIDVTTTAIVAGAIATHDWMPMHHDRDFAQSQGAPDVFMNIFSTNAYIARFLTDWAGPEALLKSINVRLGVQAVPGQVLKFRGEVLSKTDADGETLADSVDQKFHEFRRHNHLTRWRPAE